MGFMTQLILVHRAADQYPAQVLAQALTNGGHRVALLADTGPSATELALADAVLLLTGNPEGQGDDLGAGPEAALLARKLLVVETAPGATPEALAGAPVSPLTRWYGDPHDPRLHDLMARIALLAPSVRPQPQGYRAPPPPAGPQPAPYRPAPYRPAPFRPAVAAPDVSETEAQVSAILGIVLWLAAFVYILARLVSDDPQTIGDYLAGFLMIPYMIMYGGLPAAAVFGLAFLVRGPDQGPAQISAPVALGAAALAVVLFLTSILLPIYEGEPRDGLDHCMHAALFSAPVIAVLSFHRRISLWQAGLAGTVITFAFHAAVLLGLEASASFADLETDVDLSFLFGLVGGVVGAALSFLGLWPLHPAFQSIGRTAVFSAGLAVIGTIAFELTVRDGTAYTTPFFELALYPAWQGLFAYAILQPFSDLSLDQGR